MLRKLSSISLLCLVLSLSVCAGALADAAAPSSAQKIADESGHVVEMSAEVLEDKIRGGLLAQVLGNLNGLAHENKYYDEPGNVTEYTP